MYICNGPHNYTFIPRNSYQIWGQVLDLPLVFGSTILWVHVLVSRHIEWQNYLYLVSNHLLSYKQLLSTFQVLKVHVLVSRHIEWQNYLYLVSNHLLSYKQLLSTFQVLKVLFKIKVTVYFYVKTFVIYNEK